MAQVIDAVQLIGIYCWDRSGRGMTPPLRSERPSILLKKVHYREMSGTGISFWWSAFRVHSVPFQLLKATLLIKRMRCLVAQVLTPDV